MKSIAVLLPVLLLMLPAAGVRSADEYPQFEYQQGPGWQEQAVRFPALPQEDALVEVPLRFSDFPFRVYLDRNSLSVGEDRVSRYTVVLESESGVRNVFYEGIRCANGEFRSYAVAVQDGFEAMQGSAWKPITSSGVDRYRKTLETRYLCDVDKRAREPREVLVAIRRDEPHLENYY